MIEPPPIPQPAKIAKGFFVILSIVLVLCAILCLCVGLFIHYIGTTGLTRPFDNQFGDQHLKTAVALIELHKTRFGRYPDSLRDLVLPVNGTR